MIADDIKIKKNHLFLQYMIIDLFENKKNDIIQQKVKEANDFINLEKIEECYQTLRVIDLIKKYLILLNFLGN